MPSIPWLAPLHRFPIIDVMLGGEGKSSEITRDITEIEEQVLEGVIRIVCRELQTGWQAISLQFNFGARQQILQTQRLMPPDEKNLCLSFEIKMSETRGTLNLAVPAVVSNALLRKISADFSYQRRRGPLEARLQIQKKLLNCLFPVELSMPGLQVPLHNLTDLVPGQLLLFPRDAFDPAVMMLGDVRLCSATPGCDSVPAALPASSLSTCRFEPQVNYDQCSQNQCSSDQCPPANVPNAVANNPAPAQQVEPRPEPRPDLHPEFRPELRNWCEAWKTCLQNVVSQVSGTASGKPVAFEISSQPLPAADSDVWYTVVAGGAVHGEMTLRLPAASGTRLAQKFLGEAEPVAAGIKS